VGKFGHHSYWQVDSGVPRTYGFTQTESRRSSDLTLRRKAENNTYYCMFFRIDE
jgi:hypothetical protein